MGEIVVILVFLIYIGGIVAVLATVIALWRGMQAQERIANAVENIESMIKKSRAEL